MNAQKFSVSGKINVQSKWMVGSGHKPRRLERESNEIQPSPQSSESSAEIVLYLVALHKVLFYTSLEKFILLYELDVIFRGYLWVYFFIQNIFSCCALK